MELKEAAKKLRLPVGNKQTLKNSLKDAMEDKENEDSEEEEEEEEEEESGQDKDDEPQNYKRRSGRRGAVNAIARQVAAFTMKDVEHSLTHFSRDEK